MILLSTTSSILEITTSTAATINYDISYVDHTTDGGTLGSSNGVISSATTTTALAAPAASTIRQIKKISIKNVGTISNSVIVKKDISATEYQISSTIALAQNEMCQYTEQSGWVVFDKNGQIKNTATDITGYDGYSLNFYKVGTAPEAAGQYYCFSKDTGLPGAWSVGTSGINGRVCMGSSAADAGCLAPKLPENGTNYVTSFNPVASVACNAFLADFLWVNNGILPTGVFRQNITSPTFPARDINGSTNGDGLNAGLLVTTATTNAGAITNCVLYYNNSNDIGATGTMASFPATAVIGTFVPFQLRAGDKGIRSIQGINLGTTLATGAVSLVVYKMIDNKPIPVANVGSIRNENNPGIKLQSDACLQLIQLASATTATTVAGTINIAER